MRSGDHLLGSADTFLGRFDLDGINCAAGWHPYLLTTISKSQASACPLCPLSGLSIISPPALTG